MRRALVAIVGAALLVAADATAAPPSPTAFVLSGGGWGHGVGMSQWGAQAMAERGANYREILAAFYPGTRLERRTP